MNQNEQQIMCIEEQYPGTFNQITLIGSGGFSKVYGAIDNQNKKNAIKIINFKELHPDYLPYMESEIKLHQQCKNDNILKMYSHKKTDKQCFLILEYCFSDLDQIANKCFQNKQFPEEIVIIILKQIANGLCYLHLNKVIHRDIKLSNIGLVINEQDEKILISDKTKIVDILRRTEFKILDFGIAKQLNYDITNTWAGTEVNMAPEILLEQQYSYEADMYSLGVCIYQMITGTYPYIDYTQQQSQVDLIKTQNADFSGFTNPLLKQCVEKMLKFNPKERLTFKELYETQFFQKHFSQLQTPFNLALQNNKLLYSKLDNDNNNQQQIIEQQFPNQENQIDIEKLYNYQNNVEQCLFLLEEMIQVTKKAPQTQLGYRQLIPQFNRLIDYTNDLAIYYLNQLYILSSKKELQQFQQVIQLKCYIEEQQFLDQILQKQQNKVSEITLTGTLLMAWNTKSINNQIKIDYSNNFLKQCKEINYEIYQLLMKMLQDSCLIEKERKRNSQDEQTIKEIQCHLYKGMIYTINLKALCELKKISENNKITGQQFNEKEPDSLASLISQQFDYYKFSYEKVQQQQDEQE